MKEMEEMKEELCEICEERPRAKGMTICNVCLYRIVSND